VQYNKYVHTSINAFNAFLTLKHYIYRLASSRQLKPTNLLGYAAGGLFDDVSRPQPCCWTWPLVSIAAPQASSITRE